MSPEAQNVQNSETLSELIILTKPDAGEQLVVVAIPNAQSINLQFETADAEISKEGDDLTFFFADGSSITITDYFVVYNQETAPPFVIQQAQADIAADMSFDGLTIAAADFLLAVSPDAAAGFATAAGPAAGATAAGRSRPGTDGVDALVDGPADPIGELSRPGAIVDPEAPNLTLEPAPAGTLLGGGTVPPLEPSNPITPVPPVTPTPPITPIPPAQNLNPEFREVNELSGANWTADLAGLDNDSFGNITNISAGQYGNLIFDANGQARFEANDLSDLVPGQILEEVFTVTRIDANGNVTTQEITVKITGNNLNSDTVDIDNFNGSAVTDLFAKDSNGDASNLTINNGTLDLGEKSDTLTVNSMTGGKIDTGADNDTMKITDMNGDQNVISIPVVAGGASANITNMVINLGSGKDNFDLSGAMNAGYVGGDFINMGKGDQGDNDILNLNIIDSNAKPSTTGAFNSGAVGGDAAYDMQLNSKGGADEIYVSNFKSGLVGGDAGHSMFGNSVGGDDKIFVTDMNGGQLGGDAGRQMAGTVLGGNDKITITNMNSGIVAGDSGQLMDKNSQGGKDEIIITNMAGGNVYGDTVNFKENAKGGNDKITVTNMKGGNIYGDSSDLTNQNGGNDEITVTNMTGGRIYGNAGDDKVTIDSITNAFVYGGAGEDTITIKNDMSNGYIYGGDDNDTIKVGNVGGSTTTGARVYGDAGDDTITVGDVLVNGVVYGGTGTDIISAGRVVGGIIESDSSIVANQEIGNDEITTGELIGGNVRAGVGNDKLEINGDVSASSNIQTGSYSIKTDLQSGFLTDTNDDDKLTINGNVGTYSQVFTGTGNDEIIINGDVTGTVVINTGINYTGIYNGADDDKLTINGNVENSKIYTRDGADTINISGNVSGKSIIEAGYGDDTIIVGGDLSGKIYGNSSTIHNDEGRDNITIEGNITQGGIIHSGAGDDILYIGGTINSSSINGGLGSDTIIFGSSNDNINISRNGSITRSIDDVHEVGQSITNFEIVNGGDGDDTIDATAYSNGMTLLGGAGSDTIIGGSGSDTFAWQLADITADAKDIIRDFKSDGDLLKFDTGILVGQVTQEGSNVIIELSNDDGATQTVVFENCAADDIQNAINNAFGQGNN